MKRETRRVCYSFEHGDPSLPPLRELVSEKADPEKETILDYLRTHCILACPGIKYDEITPGKVIGAGHVYSDGTYTWNDVFANYVDRYNIPLPKDLRDHILRDHSERSKRHMLLRLVNKLEIENRSCSGYEFHVVICRNGMIQDQTGSGTEGSATIYIEADDAAYIIDPIMTELFCYDSDDHGVPSADGYHWKLKFSQNDKEIAVIEGWPGEDPWRYNEVKACLGFIERYIPFKLGCDHMKPEENSSSW